MNVIDRANIIHYHRQRIAQHGRGAAALGWRSARSQRQRFEVIAAAADFTGACVLDIGCGSGDLKAFLDERFQQVRYLGIDHLPEFIAQARETYRDCARSSFHQRDFTSTPLPAADYVIASGALSYRSTDESFHFRMIAAMLTAARRAVIFNMLDAARFPQHPLLIGHDIDEVAGFCRKLTPRVAVIHGDRNDHFTIVMYLGKP